MQVEVELDQVDELTLTVSCKLIALKKGTPTRLLDDEEEEDVVETPSTIEAPVSVIEAGESEGVNATGGPAA